MAGLEKKLSISKLINRIIFYIIGLFFLALGVAFSVNSQLGVSPVNSLPYVLSLIIEKDLGTMVIIVFSLYIIIQILILRKEYIKKGDGIGLEMMGPTLEIIKVISEKFGHPMMLRLSFDLEEEAKSIENAIKKAIEGDYKTFTSLTRLIPCYT